ncbi:hypothetical protein [Cupriavidus basilensis]|uniref:hypothetical protein n=1 Tax=Cupriavidus basilensis TaxID=68895 RepID=UPI0039F730A1
MNPDSDSIFSNLDKAAAEARAQGDKWIVIDRIYEHLDALESQDYQEVLARILALIEKYPELDYGGPGPFGSLIERQPVGAYAAQLLASLKRQPSTQVVGFLDRMMRMDEAEREEQGGPTVAAFLDALNAVLRHPAADDGCREFAQMCLTP